MRRPSIFFFFFVDSLSELYDNFANSASVPGDRFDALYWSIFSTLGRLATFSYKTPPRMTGHLPSSPSMRNSDFMELVWENGEVLIRGLSSKITRTTSPFSSRYLSRSKDGVKDSTFDDPISGLSSAVLGSDKRRSDKQLVDCSNVVSVNKFRKSDGAKLITDQMPGSSLKQQQETSVTRSKEKDRVNFSMFLSSGATRATSSQGLANVKPLLLTSGGCPSENEGNFMATKMKSPRKESHPDEQMVASSSLCSRGASNCPAYPLKRRYEDTDLSENTVLEEPKGTKGSKGTKGKRKTEVHSLSGRKRRDKINKKMHALKELIPNCTKEDKASMLDEAIEYLKTLQLQVQMMSMGNGVYMPSMMFHSPSTMQHLGGYSPMVVGMGMGMQMGLGCGAPTQFSTSLMSGAALTSIGIPEATATLNMLGLRSMSIPPFVSSAASFIPQLVQTPGAGVSQSAAVTPAQVDLPGGSNPTH